MSTPLTSSSSEPRAFTVYGKKDYGSTFIIIMNNYSDLYLLLLLVSTLLVVEMTVTTYGAKTKGLRSKKKIN